MANLFEYSSYKDFLKAIIQENQQKRGYQATLARAAQCQASYLSQVLSGKADLLPDQASGISDYLELSEIESEFFLTLVLLGRASTKSLKNFLEKKISRLRRQHSQLDRRVENQNKIAADIERFYYSSWYWTAIHIATSIPELQNIKALSLRLGLPLAKVRFCLDEMERYGLVQHVDGKWQYAGGAAHLESGSVMRELNHTHWRQRAILDVQNGDDFSLHYTSVVSLSVEDAKKAREFFLEAIARSRKITDPSQPEEMVCLNLDFFKV